MRLINTTTMAIEEFVPPKIPAYAILSHTWGDEEITLREYEEYRGHNKAGHQKVVDAVVLARSLQHAYIWIDTCCIDKTSSADLTEAINSMYLWYRNADICLVYLEDLPPQAAGATPDVMVAATAAVLGHCRWFSRGWTLQELVAPRRLAFFDAGWGFRGTKRDHVDTLEWRTRIPRSLLLGKTHVRAYSLAARMAWAAGRQTSRPEDTAYCLLGIFEVHIALAYGEGDKAFRRLQEEIVKHSSDLTIFAWNRPRPTETEDEMVAATGQAAAGNGDQDDGGRLPVPYRLPALPDMSPLSISLDAISREPSEEPRTPTAAAAAPRAASASSTIGSGSHDRTHRWHRARHEYCLFAPSPASFARFSGLASYLEDFENFAVTNRGLSVTGSVYLRTMERPVPDEDTTRSTTTTKAIYVMALGRQDERIVFLPLLKIGPSLFQRYWDMDMVELTRATVDRLYGVRVSDWYIQVDQRPAAEMLPVRYRQEALHVPLPAPNEETMRVTLAGDGDVSTIAVAIRLDTAAPTHLWDERDRLFLRPQPYGRVHYDAVLVIKHVVAVFGGGRKSRQRQQIMATAVVVLCRFRLDQAGPDFFVYEEQAYPHETALLLMHRSPNSCVTWQELSVWCPHLERLSDHIILNVPTTEGMSARGAGKVEIRVSSAKALIDLDYGDTDVNKLTLEVTRVQ